MATRKLVKGDTVTAKGHGNTRFTVGYIHPSGAGAVLVNTGGGDTDKPFSQTYINAADLTYKAAAKDAE